MARTVTILPHQRVRLPDLPVHEEVMFSQRQIWQFAIVIAIAAHAAIVSAAFAS